MTDPDDAVAAPELAVLSAAFHGAGPDGRDVLVAMVAGLAVLEYERAARYAGYVFAVLPAAVDNLLEVLMTTAAAGEQRDYYREFVDRFVARGRREGEARGRAKGEAEAVLSVLAARGVEVPAAARERISGCTDLAQLDTWVRRAATATTIDDLFD